MTEHNDVYIDLHMHSTASDGTFSPSELVQMAEQLNLGVISITDHDTVDGLRELSSSDTGTSIPVVPGIELSCAPPSSFSFPGSFHVLGYMIDIENSSLNKALSRIQQARDNRNPKIVEQLQDLGIDISMEEVVEVSGGGLVGRPHIAQVMVDKGVVKSFPEAFDRYLGKGKPGFVEKYRISCADAAAVILEAGGIPVLAHPMYLTAEGEEIVNNPALERLIPCIKDMGFMGMEVYYSEHSPEVTKYYETMAHRFDLLMTGGSDFHGSMKTEIQMGSGRGDLKVPYKLYERLIQADR